MAGCYRYIVVIAVRGAMAECCCQPMINGIACLSDFPILARGKIVAFILHSRPIYKIFSIDGSVNRAHAYIVGAAHRNADAEALGFSKGGFRTVIISQNVMA
ncbi:MAG: hypothetical protein ACXWM2_04180 [Parachlamydiaceae bacterium]